MAVSLQSIRSLAWAGTLLLVPVSGVSPASASSPNYEDFETLMGVYERIRSEYVRPVDDHQLIKGAIDGMVATLDPHSAYAEASDFDDLTTIATGNYGGLGLTLTIERDLVRVVSPTEDTPGWRAGVKAGDYVTRIDGELMYGVTLDQAIDKMRGKPGTTARLTIFREGRDKPLNLSVVREVIDVKPVKWQVEDGVGVININIFNGKSAADTRAALLDIDRATKGRPLGYVLDLRSNGGGVLEEAVEIADLFLDRGEIVSRRGRTNDTMQRYYATKGDLAHGLPLIVLVDAGSASASEIVAGALQEHRRALVMGERSFGKGSVQSVFPMGSRRALRLTTELYYLPSGRSVQAGGVEPDVLVPQLSDPDYADRPAIRETDLRRHLVLEGVRDDQLLEQSDAADPRFAATAAELEKKGVKDFQLFHAMNTLRRAGPGTAHL